MSGSPHEAALAQAWRQEEVDVSANFTTASTFLRCCQFAFQAYCSMTWHQNVTTNRNRIRLSSVYILNMANCTEFILEVQVTGILEWHEENRKMQEAPSFILAPYHVWEDSTAFICTRGSGCFQSPAAAV